MDNIVELAVNGELDAIKTSLLADPSALEFINSEGWTPLSGAAFGGQKDVATLLIESGSNINVQDKNGRTPLHLSCMKGNTKVLRIMLEKGADHSIVDEVGCTPLHYAAKHGRVRITHLLAEFGAQIHTRDHWGLNALQWACINGHNDVIEALADRGAILTPDPSVEGDGTTEPSLKTELTECESQRRSAEARVIILEESLRDLNITLTTVSEQLGVAEKRRIELESELDSSKDTKKLFAVQSELCSLEKQCKIFEGLYSETERQLTEVRDQVKRSEYRREQAESLLQQRDMALRESMSRCNELLEQLSDCQKELAGAEQKNSILDTGTTVTASSLLFSSSLSSSIVPTTTDLTTEITQLRASLEESQAQRDELQGMVNELAKRVAVAEESARSTNEQLELSERVIMETRRWGEELQSRLQTLGGGGGTGGGIDRDCDTEGGVGGVGGLGWEAECKRVKLDRDTKITELSEQLSTVQGRYRELEVKLKQTEMSSMNDSKDGTGIELKGTGAASSSSSSSSTDGLQMQLQNTEMSLLVYKKQVFDMDARLAESLREILELKSYRMKSELQLEESKLLVCQQNSKLDLAQQQMLHGKADMEKYKKTLATVSSAVAHILKTAHISASTDTSSEHLHPHGVVEQVLNLSGLLEEALGLDLGLVSSSADESMERFARLNEKLVNAEVQRTALETQLMQSGIKESLLESRLAEALKLKTSMEIELEALKTELQVYQQSKSKQNEDYHRNIEHTEDALSRARDQIEELSRQKSVLEEINVAETERRVRAEEAEAAARDSQEEIVIRILESDLVSEDAFQQVHAALNRLLLQDSKKVIGESPSEKKNVERRTRRFNDSLAWEAEKIDLMRRCDTMEAQALFDRKSRTSAVDEMVRHREARLEAEACAEKERTARFVAEEQLLEETRVLQEMTKKAEALRSALQEAEGSLVEAGGVRRDLEINLADERRRRQEAQDKAAADRKSRMEAQQLTTELLDAMSVSERQLEEERRLRQEAENCLKEARSNIATLQETLEAETSARQLAEKERVHIKGLYMNSEKSVTVERLARAELENRLTDLTTQFGIAVTAREWAETQLAQEKASRLLAEQKADDYKKLREDAENRLRADRLSRLSEEELFSKKEVDDLLGQERTSRIAAEGQLAQEQALRSGLETRLRDEKAARMAAEKDLLDLEARKASHLTSPDQRIDHERQLRLSAEKAMKEESEAKTQVLNKLKEALLKTEEEHFNRMLLLAKLEEEKLLRAALNVKVSEEVKLRQVAEAREVTERNGRIAAESKVEEENRAKLEMMNRVYEQGRALRAADSIAKMETKARVEAEERLRAEQKARELIEEKLKGKGISPQKKDSMGGYGGGGGGGMGRTSDGFPDWVDEVEAEEGDKT
eukprot:gene79-97_t